MMLYVKEHCAFSAKALRAVEALKVPITIKYKSEPGVIDEVVEKGGKQQFPFLVDEENGVKMYECEDIVNYLCEQYGGNPTDFNELVAHVCPS